jgi:hypothetical protein
MRNLLLIAFFILFAESANAVKKNSFIKPYFHQSTWHLCLLNASIAMPPHFFNGRIQSGFEVGMYHRLKKNKKKSFEYSASLGYFAQQSLQRNLYIKPGISKSYRVYKSYQIRPAFNHSFVLARQTNDEFKYTGNGQYEQQSHYRFQLMPSFALSANGKVYQSKKCQFDALLSYEFGVQFPFSSLSSILPIQQIHLGILIKNNK